MKKNKLLILIAIVGILLVCTISGLLLLKGNNPDTPPSSSNPTQGDETIENNNTSTDTTDKIEDIDNDGIKEYFALTDDYFNPPPFDATQTIALDDVTLKYYDMPVSQYEFLNKKAATLLVMTDNLAGSSERINSMIFSYVYSGEANTYYDEVKSAIQEAKEILHYTENCVEKYELTNLKGDSQIFEDFSDEIMQKLITDEEYVVVYSASDDNCPSLSMTIPPEATLGELHITIHYPYNPR